MKKILKKYLFKKMSKLISNIGIVNNSKSHQLNKELFEARLQLNTLKKSYKIPFSIKVKKSLEKTTNLSVTSKDFSFQKYFKIPIRNKNNDKKKMKDLSNDNVKINLNLRKHSNKKIDISNSLYFNNSKNYINTSINNKLTNSNFVKSNFSTIRNYEDKKLLNKKQIKMQKKNNLYINNNVKCLFKENTFNNDNYKRDCLLTFNLNISSFKNKFMKNNNKSGIINTSFNNNNHNYNNNKIKSRNIFNENNLHRNTNELLKKKTLQKYSLNKSRRKDITLNFHKEKTINIFGPYSKKNFLFLNKWNKYSQYQSFNNNLNKNNKTSFIKNKDISKNSIKKNNSNNTKNYQVNNVNINNYISCNISYFNNNLNNHKKFKKKYNSRNNKDIFHFKQNTNKGSFNYNNLNNYNISYNYKNNLDVFNSLKIEKKNDENKNTNLELNKKKTNDTYNSMLETEKAEKSNNDIEDSNDDSGLLSFDKIEDLIIYYNMSDINKKDNYLFYANERSNFNKKKRNNLIKSFFGSI